jgi:hypothetical protein
MSQMYDSSEANQLTRSCILLEMLTELRKWEKHLSRTRLLSTDL